MISSLRLVQELTIAHAFVPMFMRLAYSVYEHRLLRQVRGCLTPKHVGIILDGNRRHARQLKLSEPRSIYDLGAQKLDDPRRSCRAF